MQGKFSYIVGAATIVGVVLAVLAWMGSPNSSLDGEFNLSFHQESPYISQVEEELNEIVDGLSQEITNALLEHTAALSEPDRYALSDRLQDLAGTLLNSYTGFRYRDAPDGFVYGTVSNSGSTTLENVQLRSCWMKAALVLYRWQDYHPS